MGGCQTLTTGDAKLLITPVAFIAATRTIDKSKDKSEAIAKIKDAAASIELAVSVLETGELTRTQFMSLIMKTGTDPEIAYLASSLFDIYQVKLSEAQLNKTEVAAQILKQIAQGLKDAAILAESQK